MSNSFVTPWAIAHQAPLSMGFPRQEYWSALPFPSPGDLPGPGIKSVSPAFRVALCLTEPPGNFVLQSLSYFTIDFFFFCFNLMFLSLFWSFSIWIFFFEGFIKYCVWFCLLLMVSARRKSVLLLRYLSGTFSGQLI